MTERIARLSIPEPNSGCWLWTGVTGNSGYGHIGVGSMRDGSRTMQSAHRASYEAHKGKIPPGLLVRHQCDNKLCVNPGHLILGTQTENILDSVRRGRWGAVRGFAKTKQLQPR